MSHILMLGCLGVVCSEKSDGYVSQDGIDVLNVRHLQGWATMDVKHPCFRHRATLPIEWSREQDDDAEE